MADTQLPDKLILKRKDVVKYTKLDGKVLDFWQKEFGGYSPTVNKVGEIFYTRADVKFILKLKQWLITEKKSKTKIKELLAEGSTESQASTAVSSKMSKSEETEKLKIIRRNLQEILTILDKNDNL